MKKMISIIAVICLLGLTSAAFAEMIVNAGFETQDGSTPTAPWAVWSPIAGQPGTVTNDNTVVHSGSYSLAITAPGFMYGVKQEMTSGFDNTTGYQFAAYINKTDAALAPMMVWIAFDADGGQLTGGQGTADTTSSNEWVRLTSGDTLIYLPTGTATVLVNVRNMAFGQTGTIYVDDFSSEVVPEPSSLLALFGGLVGAGGMILRRKR